MAQTDSNRNNVDGDHWGKPRHINRNHYQKKFYRNRNYNGTHNGNFANTDTSDDFKNLRLFIS